MKMNLPAVDLLESIHLVLNVSNFSYLMKWNVSIGLWYTYFYQILRAFCVCVYLFVCIKHSSTFKIRISLI